MNPSTSASTSSLKNTAYYTECSTLAILYYCSQTTDYNRNSCYNGTMGDYVKDFDGWNKKKKEYHFRKVKPPLFKERDVWWTSVGINIGFEEDGKHDKYLRPVLVLRKFNKELFLGVPMSTKLKDNKYYVQVDIKSVKVSVLISQIRVFSAKRLQDKLAELDSKDFDKTKKEIIEMISFSPPERGRG